MVEPTVNNVTPCLYPPPWVATRLTPGEDRASAIVAARCAGADVWHDDGKCTAKLLRDRHPVCSCCIFRAWHRSLPNAPDPLFQQYQSVARRKLSACDAARGLALRHHTAGRCANCRSGQSGARRARVWRTERQSCRGSSGNRPGHVVLGDGVPRGSPSNNPSSTPKTGPLTLNAAGYASGIVLIDAHDELWLLDIRCVVSRSAVRAELSVRCDPQSQ